MKNRLERLFPDGKQVYIRVSESVYYYIPLDDNSWFQIAKAGLSEREMVLLESLMPSTVGASVSQNPWQNYLYHKGKSPDDRVDSIQYLHLNRHVIEMNLFDEQAFMETLTSSLPNCVTWFMLGDTIILLLNQSLYFSVLEQLKDIRHVLEFDFGCQLTFMIGQIWSKQDKEHWGELLEKEEEVFQYYLRTSRKQRVLTLSDLLYWLASESHELFLYFLDYYQGLMAQLGMDEIVDALWEEKGVQTKAAKRLFLHRNTLQHRLDKFEEMTGLDLKRMNDLALTYLAIQAKRF